jgi:Rieske Fe-S protein
LVRKSDIEEEEEVRMATCEVCGNEYDKAFQVVRDGESHTFDSFECAIHAMAPTCEHCGCRVIGHGVEADGRIFCCANCAEQSGVTALADRA